MCFCYQKTEDLSELSILCEMEFSSPYQMFFEEHLKTLPSVGPPTILAYKRECVQSRLLAMTQKQSEKEMLRERRMAKQHAPIIIEPTTFSECEYLSLPTEFVEKYYRTGQRFLAKFPDGTAQILYPSGNLAIAAIKTKGKEFIFIVQEDKDTNPDILAVFGPNGYATCYYPNGNIWLYLCPLGGQYLDHTGGRVKRWRWTNSTTTEPYVHFKPIFISLNQQVGVRILSQEQIFVSYLCMGQQAKVKVGRKIQILRQAEELEMEIQMKPEVPMEVLILLANKIKILNLLNKLEVCVNFPLTKQCNKIKPPSFLIAQTQKLISLCSACSVSKQVESMIKDILLSSHMELSDRIFTDTSN
ncbi:hypothetical protein GDO86_010178 [Hymenochirus boettgeri]|uniref:FAM194 C-terminal domain-containing protein n=1 Tax=Hymenochirus boettgeri TaxID=247094 RepID=A0A8T2JRV7_9PIPI|nr:hypothetical protein GDO86_010178 [Hymenochirus boettgeri]